MLKIHGLKKKFGNFEALRGLDMEVEEGALYGFVGPNGAGKMCIRDRRVPVPADLCGEPGGADFYAGLGKEAAAVSVRSGCGAAADLCDPDCCQEPRCGVSQRYF